MPGGKKKGQLCVEILTFFRWQWVFLLRLSLLQLGFVEAGDLFQVWFVRHDWLYAYKEQKRIHFFIYFPRFLVYKST